MAIITNAPLEDFMYSTDLFLSCTNFAVVFSERSPVRLSCRLSVVCNVRAPYSGE